MAGADDFLIHSRPTVRSRGDFLSYGFSPSSAASIAFHNSSVGSQPIDRRTKPGSHGVAPAGAALGRTVQAAERGGRLQQRAAIDEGFRLFRRIRGSAQSASRNAASVKPQGCATGCDARPGKRTERTAGWASSRAAMVSAEAHMRSKRNSSVSRPRWTSQASNGPGMAPDTRAPVAHRVDDRRRCGWRHGRTARRSGRWAPWCRRRRPRRCRNRAAAGRRASWWCCRRPSAPPAARPPPTTAVRSQMSRRGIGRRLDEDQFEARKAAVEKGCARALLDTRCRTSGDSRRQEARRVVAVGRHQHAVACLEQGKEGGRDGCHAGREGDGGCAFEMAEHVFDGFPGRVVGAPIDPQARPFRRADCRSRP